MRREDRQLVYAAVIVGAVLAVELGYDIASSLNWGTANEGERLARYTGWLVLATLGLAIAGGAQFEVLRRTARRQLRAYVAFTPKGVANFLNLRIQISGTTKNHGLTPARKIWHQFGIAAFPNPLPEGFTYPAPPDEVRITFAAFPGTEHASWFNASLTSNDVVNIMRGTHSLHLWGITHYIDAFNNERWTKFEALADNQFPASVAATIVDLPDPNFSWQWGPLHNDAD